MRLQQTSIVSSDNGSSRSAGPPLPFSWLKKHYSFILFFQAFEKLTPSFISAAFSVPLYNFHDTSVQLVSHIRDFFEKMLSLFEITCVHCSMHCIHQIFFSIIHLMGLSLLIIATLSTTFFITTYTWTTTLWLYSKNCFLWVFCRLLLTVLACLSFTHFNSFTFLASSYSDSRFFIY